MTQPDINITALLRIALDDEPSGDLSDAVLDRLASVKTLVELSRLVGVAPLDWAIGDVDDTEDAGDEES